MAPKKATTSKKAESRKSPVQKVHEPAVEVKEASSRKRERGSSSEDDKKTEPSLRRSARTRASPPARYGDSPGKSTSAASDGPRTYSDYELISQMPPVTNRRSRPIHEELAEMKKAEEEAKKKPMPTFNRNRYIRNSCGEVQERHWLDV